MSAEDDDVSPNERAFKLISVLTAEQRTALAFADPRRLNDWLASWDGPRFTASGNFS